MYVISIFGFNSQSRNTSQHKHSMQFYNNLLELIVTEGPFSLFHLLLSPGCSLSSYDGICPQLKYSRKILWLDRLLWTLVAKLRILRLVRSLASEDTGDTGIYPLPSAFYSLRLTCWSSLWQEASLAFSSKSFLLLLILKDKRRMPILPVENRVEGKQCQSR